MSFISGRTSLVSIVRDSLHRRSSLATAKCQIFPQRIESALIDLLRKNDAKSYEELICVLRDRTLSDDQLTLVLTECSSCVGLLNRETRLLVEVLCGLNWPTRPQSVVDLYCQWLLDLVTAQINHAPMAIGSLVKRLAQSENMWNETPTDEQTAIFSNVHNLIARVVAIIPMSGGVLLRCVIDNYPYYKHSSAIQQAYVHNLLWITRYLTALTDPLLTLILNRLIVMDVNIRPVQEFDDGGIFTMDVDAENDSEHLTESLDLCMLELFQWLQQEGSKVLSILFEVYEKTILPTHGTRYIQFLMLYALSMDTTRIGGSLEALWDLVASARVGPGLRQASVAHLGGLLARANFIPLSCLRGFIKKMADWCHAYIKAQDSWNPNPGNNPHGVFYSVCQSLFYLIAFKHNYMFSDKNGLIFVESLNLSKIVMSSSLNPLRMCQTSVAEAFASITRMHQVVYCHAIMENNTRHHLRVDDDSVKDQDWFPYDPYTLPRSFHWIKPFYAEYEDTINDKQPQAFTEGGCDEDDFLATSPNAELLHSLPKSSFTHFRKL